MADQARPASLSASALTASVHVHVQLPRGEVQEVKVGNSCVDGSLTGPLVRWTISIWLVGASAAFAQCKTFSRGK